MEFRIDKNPAQSITAEQWKEMHALQDMDPEKKEYAYSEVWIPVREK